MSNDSKVQQLPRKGFRQERAPTKGEVQKENQTLAQGLQAKVAGLEAQFQFLGNMLGQTMGTVRQIAPEVDVLTVLEASTVMPASEAAKKGDLVMIDYAGLLIKEDGSAEKDEDGLDKYFQGGMGLKFVVRGLGNGTLLPEFEASIEGKRPGETFKTVVTFPEKYPAKELAGKRAEFTITVHRINRMLEISPVEKTIREHEAKRAEIMKAKAEAKAKEDAKMGAKKLGKAVTQADSAPEGADVRESADESELSEDQKASLDSQVESGEAVEQA